MYIPLGTQINSPLQPKPQVSCISQFKLQVPLPPFTFLRLLLSNLFRFFIFIISLNAKYNKYSITKNYFMLLERSSIASIGFSAFNLNSSSIRISGSSYFIHKYSFSIVLRFM